MVDLAFTFAFLLFAVPLIAVELYGIWRKQKGDTISEHVWWVQKRFWPARVVVAGFCIWLLIHFGFDGSIMAVAGGSYLGRWKDWYSGVEGPQSYGDTTSYEIAAERLAHCRQVEDWGCGKGWMSTLIEPERYVGVDGTQTPFSSVVADLRTYRSSTPGLFMRHVLEHNYDWREILDNAIASFTDTMVLVVFTPMAEETREIAFTDGVNVPDLSFKESDLTDRFVDCTWETETIGSGTQYGVETIFTIRKAAS